MRIIELIDKPSLMRELADLRYGKGSQLPSRVTWWRWCKAIGVSSSQSTYTSDETARFIDYLKTL
jgi:hypothetical protein